MLKKIIAALLSAVLLVSASSVSPDMFGGFTVEAEAASSVSKPTASPKSGTYFVSSSKKSILLKCATKGATIYYSVNGGKYKKYSSAIYLSKSGTIKAYAKKDGKKSSTVSFNYELKPKVKMITVTNSLGKKAKVESMIDGVDYYYTTDGTRPTTKSKKYPTAGIDITKDCTVKILAVKSGWSDTVCTADVKGPEKKFSTEKKGQSYFNVPWSGNANVLYDGKQKSVTARHALSVGGDDIIEMDLSAFCGTNYKSSVFKLAFNIEDEAKYEKGDTLTLSQMNNVNNLKGSTRIIYKLTGKDQLTAYSFMTGDKEHFNTVELKAIDLDYKGTNPSTFYFYVLVTDENKTKHSIEGVVRVNLTGSKHKGTNTGTTTNKNNTTTNNNKNNTTTNNNNNNTNNNNNNNVKPVFVKCTHCNGSGIRVDKCYRCNGSPVKTCGACHGSGHTILNHTCGGCMGRGYTTCWNCNGTGTIINNCAFCGGTGQTLTF